MGDGEGGRYLTNKRERVGLRVRVRVRTRARVRILCYRSHNG